VDNRVVQQLIKHKPYVVAFLRADGETAAYNAQHLADNERHLRKLALYMPFAK
jgi:hypothetical protein